MNNITLQEKYPAVYKKFYQKCQVVASAPHSFMWTGDFSGFYEGLTISNKIPLRFYTGLEKINGESFEIEARAIPAYTDEKIGFTTIALDSYLVQELKKIGRRDFKGWRAHFLTEVALGKSLGGLGTLSVCLAYLRANLISRGAKYSNHTTSDAIKYLKKLQLGRPSGASAYCALIPSKYPIVYYQSGFALTSFTSEESPPSAEPPRRCHTNRSYHFAKPLDELQKLPHEPAWPIDFGLIFSGTLVQGRAVIASADELKKISLERQSKIKGLLNVSVDNFWDDYLAMLQQISSHCLLQLCDALEAGSDAAVRELFDSLNQYQNLLHFLNISTPEIDNIYSAVHRIASKAENMVGSGCKITGVGKGGEVLFALPFGKYRDKISKFVSDADFHLDYASWQDGVESEAVRIEQDLSSQRVSPLVGNDSILLKIYSPHLSESRLINPDDLGRQKVDLILDAINHKIYIKGQPTTARQMPSQKTALLLLEKLLADQSRTINNTDLPLSYAENRYDLQSKITIPLEKLTDIKFDITGTTYGAYRIALRPFKIKIGIVTDI